MQTKGSDASGTNASTKAIWLTRLDRPAGVIVPNANFVLQKRIFLRSSHDEVLEDFDGLCARVARTVAAVEGRSSLKMAELEGVDIPEGHRWCPIHQRVEAK